MKTVRLKYLFLWIASMLVFSASAQDKGKIAGKIIDKKTGEELIGVSVQIEGTSIGAATDFEGKFIINNLTPGKYNLVLSYVSYQRKVISGIEVKAKETYLLNTTMEEATKELNEVVIKGEVKKESANAVLIQQKNAVAVSSGVSADLIRRTPDRTTADVIKRVSGASIQDNKFAIVRGLGDRYNMGFINGAPLASSESDRKAFSLDLIPAAVLDNMMIIKTATPDMPADFAGGFIQINTKDIPDEDQFTVGLSLGAHSLTTFKEGFASPNTSSTDWMGFDRSTRIMPGGVLSAEASKNADNAAMVGQTKLFDNNFKPVEVSSFAPNISFNASASKRFVTSKNEFGVLAALTYSNSYRFTPFQVRDKIQLSKDQTEVDLGSADGTFYDYDNYRRTVNVGGVLNFAMKLGKNNKFSFKNLITQTGEDQTILRTGYSYANHSQPFIDQEQKRFTDYIYQYTQSRMYTGQFTGEHLITATRMKIKYTLGYTDINRTMPDFKRLIYQADKLIGDTVFGNSLVQLNPDANAFTPNQTGRFFSELKETSPSAKYEVSIPFKFVKKSELKVGGFHQYRSRTFTGRNFLITYDNNNFDYSKGDVAGIQGPDSVFNNANLATDLYFQRETTQGSDSYTASSTLHAGFIMLDNKFTNRIRLIYGVRLESFNQKVNSEAQGRKVDINKTVTDVLPSANMIVELTEKQNLRLGYARTLSRPEFREYAPLAFYEANYNSIIIGNDSLVRAVIDNIDVKWEFFPTVAQTISVNPFYKRFTNPVEMVVVPNPSFRNFSYQNASSAVNYGVEFEARIQLMGLDKVLKTNFFKDITLFSNLSLIQSEVKLSNTGSGISKRPLQGQSPYVFNMGVNYSNAKFADISVNYNKVGRRIAFVANEDQFILWENPRDVMDISISRSFFKKLQVKFTVGDVFAQRLIIYQDLNKNKTLDKGKDVDTFNYRFGRTFSLGVSYTL